MRNHGQCNGIRKLKLSVQTLRRLDAIELKEAGGGQQPKTETCAVIGTICRPPN
jgi:hypothetical protein